jgi:hypothetical protein
VRRSSSSLERSASQRPGNFLERVTAPQLERGLQGSRRRCGVIGRQGCVPLVDELLEAGRARWPPPPPRGRSPVGRARSARDREVRAGVAAGRPGFCKTFRGSAGWRSPHSVSVSWSTETTFGARTKQRRDHQARCSAPGIGMGCRRRLPPRATRGSGRPRSDGNGWPRQARQVRRQSDDSAPTDARGVRQHGR